MMAELANKPSPDGRGGERVQQPLTGRFVLFSLIAFFAVVTAVNAVMIRYAVQTMPAIDVRNAYEASQNYNGDIARAHEQAELGWTANVDLTAAAQGGRVAVRFAGRNGEPVRGLQVVLTFSHPVNRKEDRMLALTEVAPGQYSGQMPASAHGVRNLEIQARRDDRRVFRSRERVTL